MLKYFILDIDGTLTDGGIYYDDTGNQLKKFCTKDGTGIILAHNSNIKLVVLTGRECQATTRRMTELGVKEIHQNVKNKVEWMNTWMSENGIKKEEVGYIGDDVNDLGAMKFCGFVACPADAIEEVKSIADYIAVVDGGHGVVRDVIKYILKKEGLWEVILNTVYGAGT
ncbi:HAD hydrolase family protein [Lachnospiraceae bacterium 56-18]